MAELRQSDKHAQYMRLIGWTVEEKNGVRAYARKLPLLPVGVIKIQRVPWDKTDPEWWRRLAKKYRAVALHVEIDEKAATSQGFGSIINQMRRWGFRTEKMGMVATKTQVIDLKKTEADLLSGMKAKTRYNLGLAKRRGLVARVVKGTELMADEVLMARFLKLLKDNYRRVNFWGGNEKWIRAHIQAFGDEAFVVIVEREGLLGAAALYMATDGVSYYSHNGSTDLGRLDMAPTLAVWEGIREAKRRKLKLLDFDGVYDERWPVKRWLGYTRFKQGFGGEYVYYPPALVKWLAGWRRVVV